MLRGLQLNESFFPGFENWMQQSFKKEILVKKYLLVIAKIISNQMKYFLDSKQTHEQNTILVSDAMG
jgi:hypothetical protein